MNITFSPTRRLTALIASGAVIPVVFFWAPDGAAVSAFIIYNAAVLALKLLLTEEGFLTKKSRSFDVWTR